jgi:hypothetical protein
MPAAAVAFPGLYPPIAVPLVVAAGVVVIDEGADLPLEVSQQEVVFQHDAVLQGLVPAFNPALGLGMV